MAIDLSKQQALEADPKAIHKINFLWKSITKWKYTTMFLIIEKAKSNIFDFVQGAMEYCNFILF